MILVDTSIWIDHLRAGDEALRGLLELNMVLIHPFVLGELALGSWRQRRVVLDELRKLPRADTVAEPEISYFIERHRLYGRGVGYVDVHLLASARLGDGSRLWTRDARLLAAAQDLGLAADRTSFPRRR